MRRSYVTPISPAQCRALIAALPKYCANTTFTLAGQDYTTPALLGLVTSLEDAMGAVAPATAAWLAAIAALAAAQAKEGETIRELRTVLGVMFKNAPATLAELDIALHKTRGPLSTEARAAAAAKAAATRQARGTKSKKARAKITGNVTGVTVTPVMSGEAEGAKADPTAVR